MKGLNKFMANFEVTGHVYNRIKEVYIKYIKDKLKKQDLHN